jgi:hypothetical protein
MDVASDSFDDVVYEFSEVVETIGETDDDMAKTELVEVAGSEDEVNTRGATSATMILLPLPKCLLYLRRNRSANLSSV